MRGGGINLAERKNTNCTLRSSGSVTAAAVCAVEQEHRVPQSPRHRTGIRFSAAVVRAKQIPAEEAGLKLPHSRLEVSRLANNKGDVEQNALGSGAAGCGNRNHQGRRCSAVNRDIKIVRARMSSRMSSEQYQIRTKERIPECVFASPPLEERVGLVV